MIKGIISLFQFSSFLVIAILTSCESSVEVSQWNVIDTNSVLVFESKHVPLLPSKEYRPYFAHKANSYLMAVQKSSKYDFDVMYSYVIPKKSYDSLITHALVVGQKKSNRQFNGIEIHEIKNEGNVIEFALAYINGVFVLSKSSLLIESAIRVFQDKERNFKTSNAELFQFPALKSDQGDVYVNSNRISELFSGDFPLLKSIPILNDLKNLSVYDVKSGKGFLQLNGFSVGNNSSMSLFQKQKPIPFDVARYVPNQTSALVHFGASDFKDFKNVTDSAFIKEFKIGNEITFLSKSQSIMAFVEYRGEALEGLTFITDYNESYSSYQIRSVDGITLKKGFGKMFPEQPFNFCTLKDEYLIFSYSVENIKSLIDAIESDDTWGKTSDYQKFSERCLQESNLTIILKSPDLFAGASGFVKKYSGLIDSLGLSKIGWHSVQMSALDNHFYSSINFSLGSSPKPNETNQQVKSSSIELTGEVKFASLVRNHNSGLNEVFIQDSDFWIYLFSAKEGILWKQQVGGKINGSLSQVDFYKNGKLQYFFSSNNKIYLVDRLGRDVSGFPKTLSSSIKTSGVVDYDKSKNYRFLISQSGNEVYLIDKEGKNLSEWGPKKFNKEIIYAPEHFKVAGKDYFMVLLEDGGVNLFNRKGDRVNSFEVKSKVVLTGDYYIESGMSFKETFLHYLSKEGSIIKQNLEGKIISTDNLLRGKNSTFILKRINNKDRYYVYRIDRDKIVVFDEHGKILFEKMNNGSLAMEFQCIDLGNGKKIFSFLDEEQKLVQVMDESGKNLLQTPVESDIAPLFSVGKQGEVGIYSFPKNSVVFNVIK